MWLAQEWPGANREVAVRLVQRQEELVIELAIAALVIGLIASVLGFTRVAGASFAVAKFIAAIFLILFVVLILLAWGVGSALT